MVLPSWASDIEVVNSTVPADMVAATARGVLWQVAPGRFLLDVPDVARYLVEAGRRVVVDTAAGSSQVDVERYLRMTPFAALLYQKGMLALHASAVASDKGTVIIAGDSGTGKSALAAYFLKQGYLPLADDLVVITLDQAGHPVVLPNCQGIVLWPDTLALLGCEDALLPGFDANRKLMAVPDGLAAAPGPLRSIYWLRGSKGDSVEVTTLAGMEKFQAMKQLLYNSHIADVLLDHAAYLHLVAKLSAYVKISKLQRPRSAVSLGELAAVIAKDI